MTAQVWHAALWAATRHEAKAQRRVRGAGRHPTPQCLWATRSVTMATTGNLGRMLCNRARVWSVLHCGSVAFRSPTHGARRHLGPHVIAGGEAGEGVAAANALGEQHHVRLAALEMLVAPPLAGAPNPRLHLPAHVGRGASNPDCGAVTGQLGCSIAGRNRATVLVARPLAGVSPQPNPDCTCACHRESWFRSFWCC